MREFVFDFALIALALMSFLASWWINHLSDRRILRRLRRRAFFFPRSPTHDEEVANRSLTVAFAAVFFLVLGTILLMSGVLRLFGIGRG